MASQACGGFLLRVAGHKCMTTCTVLVLLFGFMASCTAALMPQAVSTAILGPVGLAAAIGAASYAFGTWIDDVTGASDAVADWIGELTGLNDELDKLEGRKADPSLGDPLETS